MTAAPASALQLVPQWTGHGPPLIVRSPIDGQILKTIPTQKLQEVVTLCHQASAAFLKWRTVPAPHRGELVRRIGQRLRARKTELAALVSWEVGKITQEALGEVQEMIDMCDFAVGLSRQLHGLTIASERAGHRLMEQWHPLGPVGVITAFNFPVAVWAWNAMLALVCGDPVIWKPSEKAPLCALACHQLAMETINEFGDAPQGLLGLAIGGSEIGQFLANCKELPLISATGSTRMGKHVATTVASRFGRALLELGGNNGMIVCPSADLDMAINVIVFSAAGTCGQRCTSLRRLIVHRSIYDKVVPRLIAIFAGLKIGHPLHDGILVGPLIDAAAGEAMRVALEVARQQGGSVHHGERLTEGVPTNGIYVRPAIVEITATAPIVQEETFAPILYVMPYDELSEAIRIHNDVPQGLSSSIFTNDMREAELFMSMSGSDCGITNVNVGTSGAEIGGAFGGEKATGGGRESGSDAWKNYMRRATNTINYSKELPLAQGIKYDAGSQSIEPGRINVADRA
jgi:aldehyde dehydrogenase (NAD+)